MEYEINLPTPNGWHRTYEGPNDVTLMPIDIAEYAQSGVVPSIVAAASEVVDDREAGHTAVVSSSSLYRPDATEAEAVTLEVEVRQIDDDGEAISQVCATTRRGAHELTAVATARDDQLGAIADAVDLVMSSPADFRVKD